MKTRILIILLGIGHHGFAKDIRGYYVTPQQDTIQATFKVKWGLVRPSLYGLQNEVECADSSGQTHTLTPQNTTSFTLFLPSGTTTFSAVKWRDSNQDYELFMIDFGGSYLKLYAYITLHSYDKSETYNYVFKKNDQLTLTEIPTIAFRKEMVKYFDDYPALAEKIQKRELTRDHLADIMQLYNTHHATKLKQE